MCVHGEALGILFCYVPFNVLQHCTHLLFGEKVATLQLPLRQKDLRLSQDPFFREKQISMDLPYREDSVAMGFLLLSARDTCAHITRADTHMEPNAWSHRTLVAQRVTQGACWAPSLAPRLAVVHAGLGICWGGSVPKRCETGS